MTRSRVLLWIAQGFGVGRIPFAPGTFGTLVGFLWLELLLWTGSLTYFIIGMTLGFGVSVWSSGRAEKILGKTDPSSVIIDEITAVPCCLVSWLIAQYLESPGAPHPIAPSLKLCGLVFASFRLFDIWKPWPIGISQRLPGGWGITVDDFLAAGYVNIVILLVRSMFR